MKQNPDQYVQGIKLFFSSVRFLICTL